LLAGLEPDKINKRQTDRADPQQLIVFSSQDGSKIIQPKSMTQQARHRITPASGICLSLTQVTGTATQSTQQSVTTAYDDIEGLVRDSCGELINVRDIGVLSLSSVDLSSLSRDADSA
jgi:hypothetical protein